MFQNLALVCESQLQQAPLYGEWLDEIRSTTDLRLPLDDCVQIEPFNLFRFVCGVSRRPIYTATPSQLLSNRQVLQELARINMRPLLWHEAFWVAQQERYFLRPIVALASVWQQVTPYNDHKCVGVISETSTGRQFHFSVCERVVAGADFLCIPIIAGEKQESDWVW